MSTPSGWRSWVVLAGAGAACVGVGLLGSLIPIHRVGPANTARPAELGEVVHAACIGSPANVAGQGGAALIAQRPSAALSPALNAALGASATPSPGSLTASQVEVLDASASAAEVVIGAKNGAASVGIALKLQLGCVGGHRVVVGANDVTP